MGLPETKLMLQRELAALTGELTAARGKTTKAHKDKQGVLARLEALWRSSGGQGCPCAPERCSPLLRCQACQSDHVTGREAPIYKGEIVAPVASGPVSAKADFPSGDENRNTVGDVVEGAKQDFLVRLGRVNALWLAIREIPNSPRNAELAEALALTDAAERLWRASGGEGCPSEGGVCEWRDAAMVCQECADHPSFEELEERAMETELVAV